MTARTWVLAIVIVLLLTGLIGFARGSEHRRGQQVGALSRHLSAETSQID